MTADAADPATGYAAAIGALAEVLIDADSLRTTLDQLLAVAAIAAPRVSSLTVTALTDDGDLTAAASTDPRAQEVDELEYALGEGPCVSALRTGEEQLVRDTAGDDRWPRFAAKAREEGFGSVAGLPLRAPDGTVIGALDAFSTRVDGLDEHDLDTLRRVCGPASAVLANARAYRRTSRIGEELAGLLEERAVVNRALGIVLGRRGGDLGAADQLLRQLADRDGSSVAQVAARLVAGDAILEDVDTPSMADRAAGRPAPRPTRSWVPPSHD